MRWTVVEDGPLDGASNMARDHALALTCPEGRGVLRLYRWKTPTLSLGRNERARGTYDRQLARQRGVEIVRRPTGGRAVLHHRELTYAVVMGLEGSGELRRVYRTINRALVRALLDRGVAAALAGRAPQALGPNAGPCFASPAEFEVVAGGRKLVGSAQVRLGRNLLQHGSILMYDDQGLIEQVVRERDGGEGRGRESGGGAVALADLMPAPPSWESLAEAVREAFRHELAGDWTDAQVRGSLAREVVERERELRETYESEAWTWRR